MSINRNPQEKSHDSSDAGHTSSPWSNPVVFNVLIAAAVVLVLLTLGVLVVRKIVTSKIPASAYADMHKLETTTLSLPPEWHRPADLPPAPVVAFHQKFERQMNALRGKHGAFVFGGPNSVTLHYPGAMSSMPSYPGILESYWTSGTLTDAESTSFTILMADLQPIIDETSAAVRIPGYTMETDTQLLPINFLEVQTFSKLVAIVAAEQARRGDCQQALETAMLPLRLSKRPAQSFAIAHLISIAQTYISAVTLYNVVEQCDDPAALEAGVRSLNELYPDVFPGEIDHWFYEELVALRFAAAYGYPVNLAPQSRANFIRMSSELWSEQYCKWIIDNLPSTDPKVASAQRWISSIRSQKASAKPFERWTRYEYMSPAARRAFGMVTGVDPVLLQHATMGSINQEEAKTRAYVAKAAIDLARLAAVERLTTGSDTSTITAYLSPPAVDPFTSGSYTYSAAITRHYSAGPDLDDDAAAIKYDATNGTTSNGDVWLTGRW